jgi:hypothetical protein
MWIDVKPKGRTQILTAFRFNVEGQPVHSRANTIAPDQTLVKKVLADGQSYQVTLNFQPEDPAPGKDVILSFEIRDANGKPIRNLEPLMALEVIVLLLLLMPVSSFMFILLKKLMFQAGEEDHLFHF